MDLRKKKIKKRKKSLYFVIVIVNKMKREMNEKLTNCVFIKSFFYLRSKIELVSTAISAKAVTANERKTYIKIDCYILQTNIIVNRFQSTKFKHFFCEKNWKDENKLFVFF